MARLARCTELSNPASSPHILTQCLVIHEWFGGGSRWCDLGGSGGHVGKTGIGRWCPPCGSCSSPWRSHRFWFGLDGVGIGVCDTTCLCWSKEVLGVGWCGCCDDSDVVGLPHIISVLSSLSLHPLSLVCTPLFILMCISSFIYLYRIFSINKLYTYLALSFFAFVCAMVRPENKKTVNLEGI